MRYDDFLKTLTVCPFCTLTDDQVILSKETALLTYSLAPYHVDHLLVVTKRHVEWLLDITEQETMDIDFLLKESLVVLRKLGYSDISILVREGDHVGKSVKHVHYHIIPNVILENTDHTGADRSILNEQQVKELITKIKSNLT